MSRKSKKAELNKRRKRIGLAVAVLALFLISIPLLFSQLSSEPAAPEATSAPTSALDKAGAWDACRTVILSNLVSPISAEFQPGPEAQFVPTDNGFAVVGYVDSNSRDDVKTRSDFSCQATFNGLEWNVADLRMME